MKKGGPKRTRKRKADEERRAKKDTEEDGR